MGAGFKSEIFFFYYYYKQTVSKGTRKQKDYEQKNVHKTRSNEAKNEKRANTNTTIVVFLNKKMGLQIQRIEPNAVVVVKQGQRAHAYT